MTREAIPEIDILQRELKESGGGLWAAANLVVLACTLALIAAISWGVGRYSRAGQRREPFPDRPADAGTTTRERAGPPVSRRPLPAAPRSPAPLAAGARRLRRDRLPTRGEPQHRRRRRSASSSSAAAVGRGPAQRRPGSGSR